MFTVELIYDADCPNAEEARAQLRRAFAQAGLTPQWQEWDRADPKSPRHARDYGSPTILVDGKDVSGLVSSGEADSCRLYKHDDGQLRGYPSVEMIASALRDSAPQSDAGNHREENKGNWRTSLAAVPSVVVAMIPAVACPACFTAYVGGVSSLGLGISMSATYLLPLTILLLVVAVGALGFRAQNRRGYGPLALGTLAAALMVVGKFALDLNPVTYGGIALLIGASLWNAWPQKVATGGSCPTCDSAGKDTA